MKTKDELARHGLAPTKKRGQNFLINPRTAERIVALAGFTSSDDVVEVGVGLGALTIPLAAQVNSVVGVELDKGIIRYHQRENSLPANVSLIHRDILQCSFNDLHNQLGTRLKMIANLPYSITNPFLFKLVDEHEYLCSITVMVQKEVAERLTARPGSKAYGIPSVLVGSVFGVESLLTLKPTEFYPRPTIDSAVLRLTVDQTSIFPCNFGNFRQLVRLGFANRRKTLVNNLDTPGLFSQPGAFEDRGARTALLKELLHALGLPADIRAEKLSIADFQRLTRLFDRQVRG